MTYRETFYHSYSIFRRLLKSEYQIKYDNKLRTYGKLVGLKLAYSMNRMC